MYVRTVACKVWAASEDIKEGDLESTSECLGLGFSWGWSGASVAPISHSVRS